MTQFLVGNALDLSWEILDPTQALPWVDPDAVTLRLKDPEGNVTSPSPAKLGVGRYAYRFDTQGKAPGVWTFRWQGDGTYEVSEEGTFEVIASSFP